MEGSGFLQLQEVGGGPGEFVSGLVLLFIYIYIHTYIYIYIYIYIERERERERERDSCYGDRVQVASAVAALLPADERKVEEFVRRHLRNTIST